MHASPARAAPIDPLGVTPPPSPLRQPPVQVAGDAVPAPGDATAQQRALQNDNNSNIDRDNGDENGLVAAPLTLAQRIASIQPSDESNPENWRLRLPSSLFFLSGMNPVRFFFLQVMMHPVFNAFIMFCIIASSVLLAADQPAVTPSDSVAQFLQIADYTFTCIFFVEMLMKIAALGFVLHPGAYLRNPWNVMDGIIAVTNMINLIAGQIVLSFVARSGVGNLNPAGIKAIRVLRVLRPLRTVTKIKPLQKLVTALLLTIPAVIDNLFLMIFIIFLFAVTGLTLFRGKMDQRCYVTGFPTPAGAPMTTMTLAPGLLPSSIPANWSWGTTNQSTIANALSNYVAAGVNLSAFTPLGTGPFQLVQNLSDFCGGVSMCGGPTPLIGGPAIGEVVGSVWDSGVQLPVACDVHIDLFQPRNMNFNSIFTAMLLVNKIVSFDNWPDDLRDCLNYAGEILAYSYFLMLTFTGSYSCVNLFLALLSDGYENAADRHGLDDSGEGDSSDDDEEESSDEEEDILDDTPQMEQGEELKRLQLRLEGSVDTTNSSSLGRGGGSPQTHPPLGSSGNNNARATPGATAVGGKGGGDDAAIIQFIPPASRSTSPASGATPANAPLNNVNATKDKGDDKAGEKDDDEDDKKTKLVKKEDCACQVIMPRLFDPLLNIDASALLSGTADNASQKISARNRDAAAADSVEDHPSEIIEDVNYIQQEIAAGLVWRPEDFMLVERKEAWEHEFDLDQAQAGTRMDFGYFGCCCLSNDQKKKKKEAKIAKAQRKQEREERRQERGIKARQLVAPDQTDSSPMTVPDSTSAVVSFAAKTPTADDTSGTAFNTSKEASSRQFNGTLTSQQGSSSKNEFSIIADPSGSASVNSTGAKKSKKSKKKIGPQDFNSSLHEGLKREMADAGGPTSIGNPLSLTLGLQGGNLTFGSASKNPTVAVSKDRSLAVGTQQAGGDKVESNEGGNNDLHDDAAARKPMTCFQLWLLSRFYVGEAMTSRYWEAFTMLITLLNTAILAADHYGINDFTNTVFDGVSVACTIIFAIDVIGKLYAFLHRFFLFGWNVFDFLLVVASSASIILNSGKGSAFSSFRAVRVLRIFRLLVQFKNLQIIITGALQSLIATGYLFVLFFMFLFMYSVLGMTLFGLDYGLPQSITYEMTQAVVNGTTMAPVARVSRQSFGTFWQSLLLDFIVITGENWDSAMRLGMTYYHNGTEIIPVLYFCTLFYVGNYIFINLSVAIIMNKLQDSMASAAKFSALAELKKLVKGDDDDNDKENQREEGERIVVEEMSKSQLSVSAERMDDAAIEKEKAEKERAANAALASHPNVMSADDLISGDLRQTSEMGIFISSPSKAARASSQAPLIIPQLILPRIDPVQWELREKATRGSRINQRQIGQEVIDSNLQLARRSVGWYDELDAPIDAPIGGAMMLRRGTNANVGVPRPGDDVDGSAPTSPAGNATAPPSPHRRSTVTSNRRVQENVSRMFLDSYESMTDSVEAKLQHLLRWLQVHIHSQPPVVVDTSLKAFSITNPVRQLCLFLLGLPAYQLYVFVLSFTNALILFFDARDDPGWFGRIIVGTDIFFASAFSLEFVVKIIALGAFWPAEAEYLVESGSGVETGQLSTPAYFRDLWNCVDFIAMVGSLLGLALPFLRVLRAFRCVRLMVIFEGPRIILTALIQAFPLALNALLLSSVIMVVLAILGVQLFKGKWYSCSDGSGVNRTMCTGLYVEPTIQGAITSFVDPQARNYSASGDALVPRVWQRANYHFDHFGAAMLSVFVLTVSDGWSNFLYNGMDSTDDVQGLTFNANPWMAFYFVAVILCCNVFALNLTMGTLINYFTEKKSEEDGTAFLTKEHAAWMRANGILAEMINERNHLVPFDNVVSHWLHFFLTFRIPHLGRLWASLVLWRQQRVAAAAAAASASNEVVPSGRSLRHHQEGSGLTTEASSGGGGFFGKGTAASDRRWKWVTPVAADAKQPAGRTPPPAAININNEAASRMSPYNALQAVHSNASSDNVIDATPDSSNGAASAAPTAMGATATAAAATGKKVPLGFTKRRFQQLSETMTRVRLPEEPAYRRLSIWEMLMIGIAVLNCIIMASITHTTSDENLKFMGMVQLVCLVIFTIEWILKFLTYGPYVYIVKSSWGKFDTLVVGLGWVAELLPGIRAIVLFRLLRVVKLIRGTGVDRILQKFFRSMSSLINIIFVIVLVDFCFAVAGVALFENVALTGPLTDTNNFRTVFRGMTVLYQCATQEGWSDVLLALGNEGTSYPPTCSAAEGNCGNYGVAVAFMVIYMCTCCFIATQLFVAFVVEIFDTIDDDTVTKNVFADIRDLWMERFGEVTWAVHYMDLVEWLPKIQRSVTKLPQYSVTSLDIMRMVKSLPIAIDSSYRVRYNDLMVALTFLKFEVDPRGVLEMWSEGVSSYFSGRTFTLAQAYSVDVIGRAYMQSRNRKRAAAAAAAAASATAAAAFENHQPPQ